jgi:hypothetical protein
MDPQEFVELELKLILRMFNIQKEIYPMVILVKDDNRYQVPVYYQNSAHKDIISQGIKDLVKKSEPDVVIYIAEAWTKIITSKFDRMPTTVSHDDPDKTEVVIVQIEFKTGERFGCEAKIFSQNDIRQIGEFKVMDSDLSMGRFIDFFPIKRYN